MTKLTIPADYSFESFGFTLTAEHLANPATLFYLVANGFKQSLSDAAAISKAELAKQGLADEDEIEAFKQGKREARFESIIDGAMIAGSGGTRVKGIEAYILDLGPKMARQFLEAQAKAKGSALPARTSDAFKALLTKVLDNTTFAERVRLAAEKRMEQDKELALLADIEI